jgi:MFS family permease
VRGWVARCRRWLVPPWGGRNLGIVLGARLSMSAARALGTVVVPLYLARLGYSGLRLGEVFLGAAIASLAISTTVGIAADRVGRKPFLVATPFLVTAAGATFALTTRGPLLFVAAAVGGIGRGAGAGAAAVGPYQPAESAFVTDAVQPRWRNDAFGRLAFFSSLGALAGGLVAAALSPHATGAARALPAYRPPFVALALLGTVSGVAALWLREPMAAEGPSGLADEASSTSARFEARPTRLHGAAEGDPSTNAARCGAQGAGAATVERPAWGAERALVGVDPPDGAAPLLDDRLEDRHPEGGSVRIRSSSMRRRSLALRAGGAWSSHKRPVRGAARGFATLRSAGGLLPRRSLPVLIRLWVTNTLNGLAIGMFGPFVTYWLYRRYGVGAGTIGVLYAITNFVTLGSAVVAPILARRFRTVRTVTAVRLVQAALLVPIALSPVFWLAGGLYVVRVFAQRIGMPLRQSYVLAVADPAERSSVAALANVPAQAAMAASPVLTGYLFDEVSLSLPFVLGGVLQFVNGLIYYAFFRNLAPEEEREQVAGSVPPSRASELGA